MFKLNLKNRILLGYLVTIPPSIIIASLIYLNTQSLERITQQINVKRSAIEKTDSITSHAQRIERSTRGYLINQQSRHFEGFQQGKNSFFEEYKAVNQLNLIQEPELKNIFEQIITNGNQLIELDEKMIGLAQNGKLNEAIQLFSEDKSSELVRTIYELHVDFNQKTRASIQQEQLFLSQEMKVLNAIALLGTALSIITAVAFGLFLASRLTEGINHNINRIVSSSNEIAATIEQQERTTAQQATAVNQTTTTMDELGASSRMSAEQAEAAATGAKQVLSLVDGNHHSDRSNGFSASSLKDKVGQIAEQILRLSEQTHQIGSISTLVSELANQTNMLALNAAVEAVRAGEHGKGFSVVASEIRKLADQSKNSAERINGLVLEIQKSTNTTVMVTDEGRKMVDQVVEAVNAIATNTQQISLTAKQQAVAIQQVVEAMNNINLGASQTASGITQTKVGTQQLNDAALDLKTII